MTRFIKISIEDVEFYDTEDVDELRKKIKEAIEQEDYEQAQIIQSKINRNENN